MNLITHNCDKKKAMYLSDGEKARVGIIIRSPIIKFVYSFRGNGITSVTTSVFKNYARFKAFLHKFSRRPVRYGADGQLFV